MYSCTQLSISNIFQKSWVNHGDVIKWKHFPRHWPFVRGIHRSLVNYPHKGQWRGALMFSLICAWINNWVNNGEAGDLRRRRAHYDVIVMDLSNLSCWVHIQSHGQCRYATVVNRTIKSIWGIMIGQDKGISYLFRFVLVSGWLS